MLDFGENIFTKDEYLLVTKEKQIDQTYAEQYLEEMYQEGSLWQPNEGKYKNI